MTAWWANLANRYKTGHKGLALLPDELNNYINDNNNSCKQPRRQQYKESSQ